MVNLWLPWLQEPWFLVLFVWLIFVREHGKSERMLDALLMVKLLQILKRVYINSQKSSRYVLAVKITNRRSRRERFFRWWWLHGRHKGCADLIKCSSTTDGNISALTEKHNILLSFKKSIAASRHDFSFYSFFWGSFYGFIWVSRTHYCNARATNVSVHRILFTLTQNTCTLDLESDVKPTCACSKLILSPGFNVARSSTWSAGNGHPPAET